MSSPPDLLAELRATRRELAAARRALNERVARGRPISRDDTVRALTAVLQHSTPAALSELRAERDRLAQELAQSRTLLRTARMRYSTLRWNVSQLAHRALANFEDPAVALEEVVAETLDSEDDRAWEEDWWVE